MLTEIRGVIHGNQIELEREPELPSGSVVVVQIQPRPLTLEEKLRLVDLLCGTWSDDASIIPVFEELERQRSRGTPREVDFVAS